MEPLSIGVSVVGLLTATAQVSKILSKFIHSGKNAPSLAKHVLREVSDIDAVLTQLRGFLDGSRSGSQSRKKLVMMDQVVVTLATCVMTFSELQSILDSLDLNQPTQFRARVGWVRQESFIHKLLEQLQWSKASLNLMLTTLTCTSMEEATESVAMLTREVHQILQINQELSSRLRTLEETSNCQNLPSSSSIFREHDHGDDASTIVPNRGASALQDTTDEITSTRFAFDFDKDLHDSWVYSRALRRNRPHSLSSSAPNSFGWSCLSDLSLANISNLSLMSLPIMGNELKNPEPYGFKKQIAEPAAVLWPSQLDLGSSNVRSEIVFPVNVLLLGVRSSGKSTIRNQLQILYGDGFQEPERMIYRTVIKESCRDAFLAIAKVISIRKIVDYWSFPMIEESYHWPSTGEARHDPSFEYCHRIGPGFSGFQSCLRCCRNLATDPRIPGNSLTMGNVLYFATRLDEIYTDEYIPSDSDILHASANSTKHGLSVFEVESVRYRVIDTHNRFTLFNSSARFPEKLRESDVVIFSSSLIDYRPSAVNDCRPMSTSIYEFERLCDISQAPIILLFTKLDLLESTMREYPITQYYADAGGGVENDLDQACKFFADRFQARNRRANGELHIYFVNATDTQDLEPILRDVRENIFTSALRSPRSSTTPNGQRVYRQQSLVNGPPFPHMVEHRKIDDE